MRNVNFTLGPLTKRINVRGTEERPDQDKFSLASTFIRAVDQSGKTILVIRDIHLFADTEGFEVGFPPCLKFTDEKALETMKVTIIQRFQSLMDETGSEEELEYFQQILSMHAESIKAKNEADNNLASSLVEAEVLDQNEIPTNTVPSTAS